jgi:hypothetical protein
MCVPIARIFETFLSSFIYDLFNDAISSVVEQCLRHK